MAIFSKNNAQQVEKKTRFIGGYISKETMSYLSLYTLVKSDSKTTLLNKALSLFADILKKENSVRYLKEQLIHRIKNEWKISFIKDETLQYTVFKKEVEKELIQKGISETLIQDILKEL